MKLIIRYNRISEIAADDYQTTEQTIPAPKNFDISWLQTHEVVNGILQQIEQTSTPLTQLAFLRRFTASERIAIRSSTDPIIVDFLHLVNLAQEILVTDEDTMMGVNYLAQQGLIAPKRVVEILS